MRKTLLTTTVLITTVALFAAACGSDDDSGASTSSTAEALAGRTFLATEATGFDLADGTVVRLTFDLDGDIASLGAHAGCNSMGGGWSIDGDRLVVGDMFSTQMACDDALMAQDAWLTAFLTAGPTVTLEGDSLSLAVNDERIDLLDRRVADPDLPLEGTRWQVDTIVVNEAASSVPEGVTATITLVDGRAQVEAGCNTGGADVTVDDDAGTIEFGPLALTKMMCEPPAMEMEAAVTAVFQGPVSYVITANRLQLTTTDGTAGLGLVAQN